MNPYITGRDNVEETLAIAVAKTGVAHIKVHHRPRLLSDNGPAFVSDALRQYLKRYQMEHVRGAPYHPQTQGKIERYHRSMKSLVKLDLYYAPSELEAAIASFVPYYNDCRYHEALDNVTPADMYFGRYTEVTTQRERIKQATLQQRREQYLQTLPYSG